MKTIEQRFIPAHRDNRRCQAVGSAYYNIFRIMDFITLHNTGDYVHGPEWYIWYLNEGNTDNPPASRKAWHFTIGPDLIVQHLPVNEVGLHSGEGLFRGVLNGNSNSVGIEMTQSRDPAIQQKIEENAAWLCAKLIREKHVNKGFPEALKQHFDWSGKYCPALIRGRPNGWSDFKALVGKYLNEKPEEPSQPDIITKSDKRWLLISGSYTQLDNAINQINQLSEHSFTPRIMQVEINSNTYYRVLVQQNDTKGIVAITADRLKAAGFTATLIDQQPAESEPKPEPDPEPPGQELPSGLLELLRQLFEMLKAIFGK